MRSNAAGAGRLSARNLRSEEDALQPLRALGGAWRVGGDFQRAGARAEEAPDRLFIDSSCIKVHRCTGGGKGGALAHGIGRTKGGRNTKLHAICDLKGRPLVLLLPPGNVHDCKVAKACIEAVPPSAELVADKGYDSKALREWLDERGTTAVIPPRKNRKVQYDDDKAIYKQRNVIESLFCRLKDWRRIATRFDHNIKNFMAAVALAATVIWWL